MTWEELIQALNGIPEDRRSELAVFTVDDGEDAWIIDAVNIEQTDVTQADLENQSIFDENIDEDDFPIVITP